MRLERLVEARRFRATDDGSALGGNIPGSIDEKHLKPIERLVGNYQEPFQFLFDYHGARYHLLMEHNDIKEDCAENRLLRNLCKTMDAGEWRETEIVVSEILALFWPHVAKESETSEKIENQTLTNRYKKREARRLQLVTLEDGSIHRVRHSKIFKFPAKDPIKNPCPDRPLLQNDVIEVLEEISPNVLKVSINGGTYCLKFDDRESLWREKTMLSRMPSHPGLPSLVGVVDAGQGNVDQFVIPFIHGKTLAAVTSCELEQKEKWKSQISDTVRILHERSLIWSDAKPSNVMIEEVSDRAILIDFGGGYNRNYVDDHLQGTMEGDLQGVDRIKKFIDRIMLSS